jgi:hypothetical protein
LRYLYRALFCFASRVEIRWKSHLTTRSSGPWVIVGRVCPRHGHRGRPLNSVVSRHASAVIRIASGLSVLLLLGCAASGSELGTWEYDDQRFFVRADFERGGACTIVSGSKIGAIRDGIGSRCKYSRLGETISIYEVREIGGSRAPETSERPFTLSYEPSSDSLIMNGEPPTRLRRIAK